MKINLSSNNVHYIESGTFYPLTYFLKSFELDFNAVSYLDADTFVDSHVLANLTLADNRFVGFNETTFEPIFSSLQSLDISGNVLVYAVKVLKWMVEKFGKQFDINKGRTACSTSTDTHCNVQAKINEHCGPNVSLHSSIALLGVAMVGFLLLCYHHRWLLKYKLFLLRLAIIGYR